MTAITTQEMEVAIANHFGVRKNIIVPNLSWGAGIHECDIFVLKKSGYAAEVEIKQSIQDFRNDFKKRHKHEHRWIKHFYFAFPQALYEKHCDEILKRIATGTGIIVVQKTKWSTLASTQISPKARKGSVKLTISEQLRVARLGVIRVWTLKRNINSLKRTK